MDSASVVAEHEPDEVPRLAPLAKVARDRYDVHPKTLHRWAARPGLGFPRPVKINGRDYLNERALDEFDRALIRRAAAAGGE